MTFCTYDRSMTVTILFPRARHACFQTLDVFMLRSRKNTRNYNKPQKSFRVLSNSPLSAPRLVAPLVEPTVEDAEAVPDDVQPATLHITQWTIQTLCILSTALCEKWLDHWHTFIIPDMHTYMIDIIHLKIFTKSHNHIERKLYRWFVALTRAPPPRKLVAWNQGLLLVLLNHANDENAYVMLAAPRSVILPRYASKYCRVRTGEKCYIRL